MKNVLRGHWMKADLLKLGKECPRVDHRRLFVLFLVKEVAMVTHSISRKTHGAIYLISLPLKDHVELLIGTKVLVDKMFDKREASIRFQVYKGLRPIVLDIVIRRRF